MLGLGYSYDECARIVNSKVLINLKQEEVYKRVEIIWNTLANLGFDGDEIIKLTVANPGLYNRKIENVVEVIDLLIELGYKKSKVIKMCLVNPKI